MTLTRIQSGVGSLAFTSVLPAALHDVRLGALYALTSGSCGLVHQGSAFTAAAGPAPVVCISADHNGAVVVDLRQSRSLARFLLFAQPSVPGRRTWDGALVCRTLGGSVIEVPLEAGVQDGSLAVLSIYNVDGELVVRAELDPTPRAARDVARAFGFEDISWADADTPLVLA